MVCALEDELAQLQTSRVIVHQQYAHMLSEKLYAGDHQLRHGLIPTLRKVIERQPEGFVLSRFQSAAVSDDRQAPPQYQLAVPVAEDAIDLYGIQRAVADISDLTGDLDYSLLKVI